MLGPDVITSAVVTARGVPLGVFCVVRMREKEDTASLPLHTGVQGAVVWMWLPPPSPTLLFSSLSAVWQPGQQQSRRGDGPVRVPHTNTAK